MGNISADQVRVFLTVVDCGSFSSAAKLLRRNQSAVSYAIANLEEQLAVRLFDRSGSRPTLTPAGLALLPDARKATFSLDKMRERGAALARGIESDLAIAVDQFCPLDFLSRALADFAEVFPSVRPHIHMELSHNALAMLLDGTCALGIIAHPMSSREELHQHPLAQKIALRPYVAAHHPLASTGRIENAQIDEHITFVLADRNGLSAGQELGMFTAHNWASSDLRVQHALIRAGAGWGFLPSHMVKDDLASGALMPLDLAIWPDGGAADVTMMVVRHREGAPGPAATWLIQRLIDGGV